MHKVQIDHYYLLCPEPHFPNLPDEDNYVPTPNNEPMVLNIFLFYSFLPLGQVTTATIIIIAKILEHSRWFKLALYNRWPLWPFKLKWDKMKNVVPCRQSHFEYSIPTWGLWLPRQAAQTENTFIIAESSFGRRWFRPACLKCKVAEEWRGINRVKRRLSFGRSVVEPETLHF